MCERRCQVWGMNIGKSSARKMCVFGSELNQNLLYLGVLAHLAVREDSIAVPLFSTSACSAQASGKCRF